MSEQKTILSRPKRHFLPEDFTVSDWPSLEVYYNQLLSEPINSFESFSTWLKKTDELSAVMQEDLGWRYITMTRNTQDTEALSRYHYFLEEISPKAAPLDNQLTRKFYDSPFRAELTEEAYQIFSRSAAKDIELFREANVPLISQLEVKAQQYGAISAAQTIDYEGKTLTLQQAGAYLEKTDRRVREQVWQLISKRRTADRETLDALLEELLSLRHEVARNAGFSSFTDYQFQNLGRFDYGRADCLQFHEAIAETVTPLYAELMEARRKALGLAELKPWDTAVDTEGAEPLHPFATPDELTGKTIALFEGLKPELAQMIKTLQAMGHLDLGSRVGKAPGGYNYPLNETGVPFIFMNAVGTQGDLTTMVHESGHAIHSFVTRELALSAFKNVPSEIAELASMSMELISMEGWKDFYPDAAELRRARIQQILRTITILPWIAVVDAFQTWAYDHPGHSRSERQETWLALHRRFFGESVNWDGLETERAYLWQRQLHIYEVPFYYIEYGMAQLGALQVWRNYRLEPAKALNDYLAGLRLGYTRSIGKVYEAAGVRFDFSVQMMVSLMTFVKGELQALGYLS